jgi:hypothetical protein
MTGQAPRTFLGLAICWSQNVSFGGPEFLASAVAVGCYTRSALRDNHFRPMPFNIRGYTIR